MADPVNDNLLNQVFPGEMCSFYIGSYGETLINYSAYVTNFRLSGFSKGYKLERSMGTYMVDRADISPAEVSVDLVFLGSVPKLHYGSITSPSTGYTEYNLSDQDKKFKLKFEFMESVNGSYGSPISTNDYAYKEVYYNARGVSLSIDQSSESYATGKLSFWVAPFNELGSANFRSLDKAPGQNLSTWGTRESAWDTDVNWS